MDEKLNMTIENICDWINDRLNDSLTTEDAQVAAVMVSALSELVAARADSDLEERVADLEGQVQSQQGNIFVPEDSDGSICLGNSMSKPD